MLLAGAVLAVAVGAVQEWLGGRLGGAWFIPEITRDAGTRVLEIIATSTITVAGLVSSVMVVAVQLSSSQFSPRVLHRFLRDRINQVAIGVITGTFAFSVLTLAQRDTGRPGSLRDLSVTLAVVLAGASLLAILAFIDHTARMMQAGRMIRDVTEETQMLVRRMMNPADNFPPADDPPTFGGPSHTVRAEEDGWVQQIDVPGLFDSMDEGASVRIDLPVGKFSIVGAALCTIWPSPRDPEALDAHVRATYELGDRRAMRDDVAFGIRQLVDMALRALSPGINDPGTAYEVVTNLGAVLSDVMCRDVPPRVIVGEGGRHLFRPREPDHRQYVGLAFEQLRLAAAPHPAVAVAMLNTLDRVADATRHHGHGDRIDILRDEAALIVEQVLAHGHLEHDRDRVVAAAERLDVRTPAGHASDND